MRFAIKDFAVSWAPSDAEGMRDADVTVAIDGTTVTLSVTATRRGTPVAKTIKLPLAALDAGEPRAVHAQIIALLDDQATYGDPAKPPVAVWPKPRTDASAPAAAAAPAAAPAPAPAPVKP